jgi:hypothetical protein
MSVFHMKKSYLQLCNRVAGETDGHAKIDSESLEIDLMRVSLIRIAKQITCHKLDKNGFFGILLESMYFSWLYQTSWYIDRDKLTLFSQQMTIIRLSVLTIYSP